MAFENAFDRLLDIITEEGLSDGGELGVNSLYFSSVVDSQSDRQTDRLVYYISRVKMTSRNLKAKLLASLYV